VKLLRMGAAAAAVFATMVYSFHARPLLTNVVALLTSPRRASQ
jgi:hypothetical protein